MLNNDGEEVKQNITDVNLLTNNSKSFGTMSLTDKNLKKSRSSSATRIFKNADCMSLIIAYLLDLNRTKISNIFGNKVGPKCKLSLIEGPF